MDLLRKSISSSFFVSSVWPALSLIQLLTHTPTSCTLHSPQSSLWHIVSQLSSYSAECDALMGLHHLKAHLNKHTDSSIARLNKHTHSMQSLCRDSHPAQIHSNDPPPVFLLMCVLCMLLLCRADWLMGLWAPWISDQSRIDWLTAPAALMTNKWNKQDEIGGLQEIPSPCLLHSNRKNIQSNLYWFIGRDVTKPEFKLFWFLKKSDIFKSLIQRQQKTVQGF